MIPMQAVVISIGSVTKCFDASDRTHLAAVTGNRDSKQEDLRFLLAQMFQGLAHRRTGNFDRTLQRVIHLQDNKDRARH